MTRLLAAFVAGGCFGVGLVVAGATDPSVVRGFLDVGGAWDPRLLSMFVGAVLTYGTLLRLVARRSRPLLAPAFDPPVRGAVDVRLVVGAAIFGVGWGLAGICPGPAFTSLLAGSPAPVVFTGAMLVGMGIVTVRTAPDTARSRSGGRSHLSAPDASPRSARFRPGSG